MKITIFGASGRTGTQVVRQALAAGHDVTAVVRDPGRLDVPRTDRLTVPVADLRDVAQVAPLVTDAGAVISAIGPGGRGPTTVCTDTAEVIIAAMRASGTTRLVVVSASGPHTTGDGVFVRTVVKPVLQLVLRDTFTDLLAMEDRVRASGLDWTIVCPPRLTEGRQTGSVRSRLDANVRGGFSISRADLADFVLRAAADPALVHHAVSVAHA